MPADPTPNPTAADASLDAARDAAVVCDLAPLRVLAVSGPDAAAFLQGQLSADIDGIAHGSCKYASFNSPKGRMLANFVLWRDAAAGERFLALLPEDLAQSVAKRLSMYVLRAKVKVADVSREFARFGVGGPAGADALRAALAAVPARFATLTAGSATVLGLPGPRFVAIAPVDASESVRALILAHAKAAPFEVWRWLTIRAGVPVVTAATQDRFVAQTANWDLLGGVDFQKGCYTGQEIIARMHYLGRLKERTFPLHADVPGATAGDRIWSAAFGDQPCGTVVNAARAPGGGCDLLAVLQLAAAERADARLGTADGPLLTFLPLPYPIPAAGAPRGRSA